MGQVFGVPRWGITPSSVLPPLSLALIAWVLYKRRSATMRRLPPGPPSVPILGCLPFTDLAQIKIPEYMCSVMTDKYGDIFHLWLGNSLVVVLASYRTIREALLDNVVVMAGRPEIVMPNYNSHTLGIFHPSYTEKWKHESTLTLSILKDFGFGKTVMEQRTLEEVNDLLNHLDDRVDKELDPAPILRISVSNIIAGIFLGKTYQYDDQDYLQFCSHMAQGMDTFLNLAKVLQHVPLLRFLPSWRKRLTDFHHHHDKLLEYIRDILVEHKRGHVKNDQTDFIHAYLDREEEAVDQESLLWIVRDMMIAGTDTVTTTLAWSFIYMANYPDVQQKVQEELDSVLAGRLPRLQDKARLPYTEAVIKEIQRVSAVASETFPHVPTEDVVLSGYHIPKGTIIHCSLWAVMRDPKLWTEPDQFKPERFLTKEGEVLHRPEFIPFSLGRRSCLGENLAKQELFLYFASILRSYNIFRPEGVEQINETGQYRMVRVPLDFQVILRKRDF